MNASTTHTGQALSPAFDMESIMENVYDNQMIHLPLDMISVRDGFNPRRFFAEEKLNELVASIKAQGIIQPVVVKPSSDGSTFHLIAGERRFRAATLAAIDTIPAVIRTVTDEEALAMAVTENSERQDVSAAEEAKACQRMLTLCKGDRTEAALALGWTEKKLESRLTLLHCTEGVLDALEQRKIAIGHAELLAGLTPEMQDSTLPSVIERRVTVTVLRDQLGKYAYKLSDAVFDQKGCNGCPHNSSITADLFDESLSDGHCMNRECYDGKTRQHLEVKKTEMSKEYPVIWLDVERPADTRCHLMRDGQNGVGREQYEACQGCGSFGALMNTGKGKEGEIETGLCFDMTCNSKMVKAHQKEVEAEKTAPVETAQNPAKTASTPTVKPADPKIAAETPKRVKEYIQACQYKAAAATVWANQKLTKIMSLIALSEAVTHKRVTQKLENGLKTFGAEKLLTMHNRADKVTLLHSLNDSELDMAISAFAATLAGGIAPDRIQYEESDGLKTAHAILNAENVDMRHHFLVDKDYLETLTVSGLKALVNESGFSAWYDSKEGKKVGHCEKEILHGKRDEQIQHILNAGFDWKGYLPTAAKLRD